MRSKLFKDKALRLKTCCGRWVVIGPGTEGDYPLYDLDAERAIGRILLDEAGHWIYDGSVLNLAEQEEVAAQLTGNRREMAALLGSLGL